MNLPLVAVLLFYLALPGVIARRSYLAGVFSKNTLRLTTTDEILVSLTLSVPFHLLVLAPTWFRSIVRVDLLAAALTGEFGENGQQLEELVAFIGSSWRQIAFYTLVVCLLAAGAGWGWRTLVRVNRWDCRFKFLRSASPWYYLLTGEILNFPEMKEIQTTFDFPWIDAVQDVGNEATIYSGIPIDFHLGPDGTLDRIYIRKASRSTLPTGPQATEQTSRPLAPELIPGHYFVLPASRLININVTYYQITKSPAEVEAVV